jgi:hypothetical protein
MTITALFLAAIAKATSPSGIEYFNASFLKSIGFIVH